MNLLLNLESNFSSQRIDLRRLKITFCTYLNVFFHSDISHGSDKRRMNIASGLSPFFLVDGCKAFSAWMASIAPREESTPSPRQAPHLITTGQEDDRSPARSPSLPCSPSMLQDVGLDAGKTFRSFLSLRSMPHKALSLERVQASTRAFPPPPPLCTAASRWKRRRRRRLIGSTYVSKDVSISHLLAKWRLTSNENIAFFQD